MGFQDPSRQFGFKSGEVEVSSRAVWDVVMRCLRSLPLRSLKNRNVSFRGSARTGHPELVLCIKSPWNFQDDLSIFYCVGEGSLDSYRAPRWKQHSSFVRFAVGIQGGKERGQTIEM